MDTALSEDQTLLRDSLRDLLAKEADFGRLRDMEKTGGFDTALWAKLAELGWLGLAFPESSGGGGGSLVDVALAVEELARVAALVPYAEVMMASATLSRFVTPAADAGLEAAIMSGQAILVPAILDEADSFDALAGTADRSAGFSGSRLFVDYGASATGFLVRAEGAAGTELRLIDATQESVKARPLETIARVPSAAITFNNAAGERVAGTDGYAFLLQFGRTLAAVQCLGYAQAALDMTLDYVRNRVQFGRPIGSFQAVQHHCANMALATDAARFLVYEAAWAVDQGCSTGDQVATAKAWASKTAVEVTALAHQLHGGIGVTEEYDLHFFSLRAKERAIAWGTADECLAVAARTIEQPVEWA